MRTAISLPDATFEAATRRAAERGEVHGVDLGEPHGSRPGTRHPVLVASSDSDNTSRLGTVVVVVIASNTALADLPGDVVLPASATGLPKDSAVNVTAVVTLDKTDLDEPSPPCRTISCTTSPAVCEESSTSDDRLR